jgi:hypothetical protein
LESGKFTAADLERWLDELLKWRSDDRVLHDFWPSSPRGEALRRVIEIVYSFSIQKNETFVQTKSRLVDVRNLFLGLLSTVMRQSAPPYSATEIPTEDILQSLASPSLEPDIWHHRDDLFYEFRSKGCKDDSFLWHPYISSIAASMIERPWLDSHFMEWVIVDSLICDEIRQFGRSILENPFASREAPLFLVDSDYEKGIDKLLFGLARAAITRGVISFIILMVFPLAGAWYGFRNGYQWLFLGSAAVLAIGLSWSAYVYIRAAIMRLLGRQPPKTPLQRNLELWNLMHNAYRELAGPVIDPTRAKRALEAAAENGVVWDGAIYAILNRVIARDPASWVTDDSHSYRGPAEP